MDIKNIIEYATFAPSGENSQPWKFIVNGNKVQFFNLPNRDQSLYNWGQRASYMANGAALENIIIAASNFGYIAKYNLFPDSEHSDLIANIEFIKANTQKDSLFDYIKSRCTNRKSFDPKPLKADQINELLNCNFDKNISFKYTQEKNKKNILGRAGSVNEEIMLNNEYLHKFFFDHISWTKEEDRMKKIGFFIDTLELPTPAKLGFKFFSSWERAKILNILGLYKMVSKQNAIINSMAAGFGILTIKDISPESFINAGRSLQRLWLTATKFNLGFQPLTGVLFFMLRIQAGEVDKFSSQQIIKIKKAYKNICEAFDVPIQENVVFMFRVGNADKPSARSSKFSINEVIDIKE